MSGKIMCDFTAGKQLSRWLIVGVGALLGGLCFYAVARPEQTLINQLLGTGNPAGSLSAFTSLPSFLFVVAFASLHLALVQAPRAKVAGFWIGVNTLWECCQWSGTPVALGKGMGLALSAGVFDWSDIAWGAAGGLTVWLLAANATQPPPVSISHLKGLATAALFGTAMASTVASSEGDVIVDPPYKNAEPMYMAYETLRAAVHTREDEPLRAFGKIYRYQHLLLINVPNKGIHVYDNTDPTEPHAITYIDIPGNLDMAVRDGYLYADSFIDFVVIDLNALDEIKEIGRIENVFPYDPYQAIPDEGIYLGYVDSGKGVVIGYAHD